jgi:hypothetical protein
MKKEETSNYSGSGDGSKHKAEKFPAIKFIILSFFAAFIVTTIVMSLLNGKLDYKSSLFTALIITSVMFPFTKRSWEKNRK